MAGRASQAEGVGTEAACSLTENQKTRFNGRGGVGIEVACSLTENFDGRGGCSLVFNGYTNGYVFVRIGLSISVSVMWLLLL